jgi:intein-encoded DNA endonuclease-like protein
MGGDQLEEAKIKAQYNILSKKKGNIFGIHECMQMIEETQAMVDEEDNHEDFPNDEKNYEWIQSKHMDIWNDESQLGVPGQNAI